jgi:lysophospholipase L1-like esterase
VKREWLLLLGSVVLTLGLALGVIRVLAPELLGVRVPIDRQVVRLDKALPPFYDGVFDTGSQGAGSASRYLSNDPLVGHRHRTLVPENSLALADRNAPFDLLGFRNRSVPVVADVVAIGDSQTLGENVTLDRDWPSALRALLRNRAPVVYNMSVDGWGAVQYLYIFEKALRFRPRVVVVAYYTGNDPADALHMAYDFEPWKSLRGQGTRPETAPSRWPPKEEDMWPVAFPDGTRTVFTAAMRLASNDRSFPGTAEAYRIMLETARRMDRAAAAAKVGLVFTVIPTKELVFAPKVRQAGIAPPPDYAKLVGDEAANVAELAKGLRALGHAGYVDVVKPLQRAALAGAPIYLENSDGHPVPGGYAVIAAALAPKVVGFLPEPVRPGLVLVPDPTAPGQGNAFLIRYGGIWRFADEDVYLKSGWKPTPQGAQLRHERDLANLPFLGQITEPDPVRFGPPAPAP